LAERAIVKVEAFRQVHGGNPVTAEEVGLSKNPFRGDPPTLLVGDGRIELFYYSTFAPFVWWRYDFQTGTWESGD
jgi:hypothetical protein